MLVLVRNPSSFINYQLLPLHNEDTLALTETLALTQHSLAHEEIVELCVITMIVALKQIPITTLKLIDWPTATATATAPLQPPRSHKREQGKGGAEEDSNHYLI